MSTARGAPAPAPAFGTFVHVATNDLGTASARQAVADAYSIVILRGQLSSSIFADLRQRRPGIVLLAYEKSAGLNASDVSTIAANHPEWIARDASGAAIHPRNIPGTSLGDLTNAGFRAYQASRIAAEVRMGADGAFLDTLGTYFPPDFYTGRPTVAGRLVTDRAWRDGSVDLVRRVKAATDGTVIVNAFGLGTGNAYARSPADADVLIAAADGVQIEGFTRWGDAPAGQVRRTNQWDQDLALVELLGRAARPHWRTRRSTPTQHRPSSLRCATSRWGRSSRRSPPGARISASTTANGSPRWPPMLHGPAVWGRRQDPEWFRARPGSVPSWAGRSPCATRPRPSFPNS